MTPAQKAITKLETVVSISTLTEVQALGNILIDYIKSVEKPAPKDGSRVGFVPPVKKAKS